MREMSNSRTHNTLLNASAGTIYTILNVVLSFVTRTIFVRSLGAQYTGVSSVFNDILTMLSFAELGIGSAITFALYEPIAKNDHRRIGALMRFYQKAYRIIASVVLVVGLSLIPFLKYIITDVPDVVEDIRLIYALYIFRTSISYLLIYKATLLTASQRDYETVKIKIVVSIVKTVIECFILLVFHQYLLYLVFNIGVTITQNILISRKADKLFPELREKHQESITPNERKKLFTDIRALFIYQVSGIVLSGTDSIIVSSFVGTIYAGILGNYTLISNQLYNLIAQVFGATSASVGNLAVAESKEAQYAVFKKLLFLCFTIYCFCCTCLWVLFQPFITLWLGKDFLLPTAAVVVMVVDFYVRGMMSPISSFRTGNGLFVQAKYRPLVMSVINLAVSLYLAPRLGITGVLLGTVISRLSTQVWYDAMLIYKNVFEIPTKKYFITYFKYALTTFASCAVAFGICSMITISNDIVAFVLKGVISVIVPILAIVLLYSRTEEFVALKNLVSNILKKVRKGGKK